MQFKFVPEQDSELFKEAAGALYMMYRSLIEAGFSEEQALQVVVSMIRAGVKGGD